MPPALAAVAWALRAAVWACLAASAMLVAEAAYMGLASLAALWRRPQRSFIEFDTGINGTFVSFLQVYKLSISAACALTWPPDRIIIQVLDDSTDPIIKELVELECLGWASKKINIKYEVRNNRKGYKAGALKKGMEHIYAQQCDFVAIFDADFQPESDFLSKTIPFLVHNPKIAFVQTRWEFGKHKDIIF
ncbi:probable glucomannan 4-beta-mannosyltransferase 2 [Panicum virgatum]|uniref:probable glucomannan 4-beta-mannosyltransferase 2 n=1 Tax=Panicum virgatum TaxID=38727 RepID=UPI0019D5E938|nr:probable glucomannan 4-beta-mannosyltransferase 2 [Panicum virgatum]